MTLLSQSSIYFSVVGSRIESNAYFPSTLVGGHYLTDDTYEPSSGFSLSLRQKTRLVTNEA